MRSFALESVLLAQSAGAASSSFSVGQWIWIAIIVLGVAAIIYFALQMKDPE